MKVIAVAVLLAIIVFAFAIISNETAKQEQTSGARQICETSGNKIDYKVIQQTLIYKIEGNYQVYVKPGVVCATIRREKGSCRLHC